MQIPRSSSPRQRGYGRLGMTRKWLAARLKRCPPDREARKIVPSAPEGACNGRQLRHDWSRAL